MMDEIRLSAAEVFALARDFLLAQGLTPDHAVAMAGILTKAQRDGSLSHGLQRLPGTLETMAHPRFNRAAAPVVTQVTPAAVRVNADYGFSILGVEAGLPALIQSAKTLGIAFLAVNNGFHSTALWPVVEEIAAQGLAAISMNPTHDWVAPAGGTKSVMGTNPLAFAWPRPNDPPYVFDFATTAASRADIAMHRQRGERVPEDWGLDADGQPTTDAGAILAGAMLPFGGHKGSALATMIELLSGPLIGDRTSRQSSAFDEGHRAAPCHGELIIALDPLLFGTAGNQDAAEAVLKSISEQGARLPGQRRHRVRRESLQRGILVNRALYQRLRDLMG